MGKHTLNGGQEFMRQFSISIVKALYSEQATTGVDGLRDEARPVNPAGAQQAKVFAAAPGAGAD